MLTGWFTHASPHACTTCNACGDAGAETGDSGGVDSRVLGSLALVGGGALVLIDVDAAEVWMVMDAAGPALCDGDGDGADEWMWLRPIAMARPRTAMPTTAPTRWRGERNGQAHSLR